MEAPVAGRRGRKRVARGALARGLAAAVIGVTGCSGEAPQEAVPAEVSLDAIVTIEPGGAPFGRIADIELGDDGAVYVLDAAARAVRVFDPSGRELRSFGARGQGPGELEDPVRLLWDERGSLWVLDPGNGRLTAYDQGGGLVGTRRTSDLLIVFPFAVTFTGADTMRWAGISSPDPSRPSAAWVEAVLSESTVTPTRRETLGFVEWPTLFEHRTEEAVVVLSVPFSGEPRLGFDAKGRLWYAHTGTPDVRLWSPGGGLGSTAVVHVERMPVTPADRAAALQGPELEEVRSIGRAAVAEMNALMPEAMPALDGFFFGPDRLWIVRAPADAADPTRTIDLFDLEGTPVGRARARLATDPTPRVRGGVLAAVIRDDLGIESVALYRIGG